MSHISESSTAISHSLNGSPVAPPNTAMHHQPGGAPSAHQGRLREQAQAPADPLLNPRAGHGEGAGALAAAVFQQWVRVHETAMHALDAGMGAHHLWVTALATQVQQRLLDAQPAGDAAAAPQPAAPLQHAEGGAAPPSLQQLQLQLARLAEQHDAMQRAQQQQQQAIAQLQHLVLGTAPAVVPAAPPQERQHHHLAPGLHEGSAVGQPDQLQALLHRYLYGPDQAAATPALAHTDSGASQAAARAALLQHTMEDPHHAHASGHHTHAEQEAAAVVGRGGDGGQRGRGGAGAGGAARTHRTPSPPAGGRQAGGAATDSPRVVRRTLSNASSTSRGSGNGGGDEPPHWALHHHGTAAAGVPQELRDAMAEHLAAHAAARGGALGAQARGAL